jgi:hypothetical protein
MGKFTKLKNKLNRMVGMTEICKERVKEYFLYVSLYEINSKSYGFHMHKYILTKKINKQK